MLLDRAWGCVPKITDLGGASSSDDEAEEWVIVCTGLGRNVGVGVGDSVRSWYIDDDGAGAGSSSLSP